MKNRIFNSFIWSGVEKFGNVFLAFVFNWVLARYFLSPTDFGVVGMMNFFIILANTTVIGGFGQALIQKQKPTNDDYSTVFYCNLILAISLYLVLWIIAPYISNYYGMDLTNYIRISSISLLFNSTIIVQRNILVKNLRFKKLSLIYTVSSILGYFVGVIIALNNGGVWSLIISTLSILLTQSLFYWVDTSWKPELKFSKKSFKELFNYGFFMFLSNIIETVYENITYLIIGKNYNSSMVGFYTQADKLQKVPIHTFSTAIDQVVFPWFSNLQQNIRELRANFILCFKTVSYISLVVIVLLILVGDEIILILFTEKWSNSIPFFKILCLIGVVYIIDILNENILKCLGKSKLYFNLRLVKRLSVIIALLFTIKYGINIFLYFYLGLSFVSYVISSSVNGKIINYGFVNQFKYLILCIIITISSFIVSYYLQELLSFDNIYLIIISKTTIYLLAIFIFSFTSGVSKEMKVLINKLK